MKNIKPVSKYKATRSSSKAGPNRPKSTKQGLRSAFNRKVGSATRRKVGRK